MLHVFDSNNWIRIQYSVDTSGLVLRNLYHRALAHPTMTQIFVFDGRNSRAARRQIYPGYKAKRQAAPDEFYKQLDVAKKVMRLSNQLVVEIEGYEADDVIASIVKAAPKMGITIWSNDGDFRTLCSDHVKMSDPTLKAVEPSEVRLFKTLVGDTSDNIPGFKGFGKGTFEKLTSTQKFSWTCLLEGTRKVEEFTAEDLGLKLSQLPWLILNLKELQGYWKIVNFLDVPDYLLEKGTTVGTVNVALANQYLSEVMQ